MSSFVKRRALAALRRTVNPFELLNELARVYRAKVEMRVTYEYNVWKVCADCETELTAEEFRKQVKSIDRYLIEFATTRCGQAHPIPLDAWGNEFAGWRVGRTYYIHKLVLEFPKHLLPPSNRPDAIARYELAL